MHDVLSSISIQQFSFPTIMMIDEYDDDNNVVDMAIMIHIFGSRHKSLKQKPFY